MIIHCENLGYGYVELSTLPNMFAYRHVLNNFYFEYNSKCDTLSPYDAYELGIIRRKFLKVRKIQSIMEKLK